MNELFNKIDKLYDADDWKGAIKLYNKSGESVKTPDVQSQIAVAYNNLKNNGDYVKAIKILEPLENKTSNELQRLYRLTFAYYRLCQHEKIVETANKGIALSKEQPELNTNDYVSCLEDFRYEAQIKLEKIERYNNRKYSKEDVEKVIQKMREYSEKRYNAFTLNLDDEVSEYDSKVGGVPYMPYGFEYPCTKDNIPLRLLAQINFDEMPKLQDFPTTGMLQFFVQNSQDGIFQEGTETKVIYHEKIDKEVMLQQLPENMYVKKHEYFPFHQNFCAKIIFEQKNMATTYTDVQFEKLFKKCWQEIFNEDMDFDELYEIDEATHDQLLAEASTEGHMIGGYPFFTQGDPRDGWADEANNHGDKEIQLLQLDSDYDLTDEPNDDEFIGWGDNGLGHFFISKQDLQNKNFTNVLFYWDCY